MNENTFYDNLFKMSKLNIQDNKFFYISKIYNELTKISLNSFTQKSEIINISSDSYKIIATNYSFLCVLIYGYQFFNICDTRKHLLNELYSKEEIIEALFKIVESVNKISFFEQNAQITAFMIICSMIED